MSCCWIFRVAPWILVCLLAAPSFAGDELTLQVYCNDSGSPRLEFSVPDDAQKVELFRSTSNLVYCQNAVGHPIVKYVLERDLRTYDDDFAPQGVTLYYQLKVHFRERSPKSTGIVAVATPVPARLSLQSPSILIDKLNYTLYLLDSRTVVRRIPIALGRNPQRRKLYLDRASTPEGLYYVTSRQPTAEFYRAFDINYPNAADRERYALHEELGLLPSHNPDIGGDIQIHGKGIDGNWTWGCVAMRNRDIDWLFSFPELQTGVPVSITGNDLTFEDLKAISETTNSERQQVLRNLRYMGFDADNFHQAVGKFQYQSNLPITGQLDSRTRNVLRHTLEVWKR